MSVQRMSEDDGVMTGADFLGVGIGFVALNESKPRLALDFKRAAEAVMDRLHLCEESGMTEPFTNWSFHRVAVSRWVARLVMYKRTEPLYIEWNSHLAQWDDRRAYNSVAFIAQEPTRPLRVRPRGTIPQDSDHGEWDD